MKKSKLALADAVKLKDQYYNEFTALAQEADNYLQKNGSFKKADKLIERAYRSSMQMNQFRMELAATSNIEPKVKAKLMQVVELEADAIDGLYRGMTESRDGGSYKSSFRYSAASQEAFKEENANLHNMLK